MSLLSIVFYNGTLFLILCFCLLVLKKNPKKSIVLLSLFIQIPLFLGLARLFSPDFFGTFFLYAFAVFLHIPLFLLGNFFLFHSHTKRFARLLFALMLLILLIGIDAFWIEPYRLEITNYSFQVPHLKKKLKIAILADLQTDQFTPYEQNVFAQILHEKPDILVCPGDYIQEAHPQKRNELYTTYNDYFQKLPLHFPLGIYCVQGNVDPSQWPILFQKIPATLFTQSNTLEQEDFSITGLSLRDSFTPHLEILRPNPNKLHLVFGHAPDFALGRIDADILIAGHTHGGQVQIPGVGPLFILSSVPRSWGDGVTLLPDGRKLIVSRGIGMERENAPRLRFFCRPQLIFLTLEPMPP